MKILYFVEGPATAKEIATAKNHGATIRNALACGANDFTEKADAVFGKVPKRYAQFPGYDPKTRKITQDEPDDPDKGQGPGGDGKAPDKGQGETQNNS